MMIQKYCTPTTLHTYTSAKLTERSYKFRQASDFWYLTGFEEPDSAVILEKTSCSRGYRMTMFSLGKDSHKEKWEGARTSSEDIAMHFKADDAQPITQFPPVLKSLASTSSNVYLDVPPSASISRRGRHLSHKAMLKVFSRVMSCRLFFSPCMIGSS